MVNIHSSATEGQWKGGTTTLFTSHLIVIEHCTWNINLLTILLAGFAVKNYRGVVDNLYAFIAE